MTRSFKRNGAVGLGLAMMCLAAPVYAKAPELADVKVYPADVNLTTMRDRQSLVVQATYADGLTRDVTAQATYTFDKNLVRLEQATFFPLKDGTNIITVKFGGRSLKLPLKVEQAKVDRPISFKLDVMPVFMKAGCNSGGCHGAARGKDGFRLSLFGFDPDGDYQRLTRENIARRINLSFPEESLLVEKGAGLVPHTGGKRFETNSELAKIILEWQKVGTPKDVANVPTVTGLDIQPKQAVMEGGTKQQMTVRATYSDGTDRDVTSLALFLSNNDVSAKMSQDGQVSANERGEAFVMARFSTYTVGSQVLVIPKGLKFDFPKVAENNFIDTMVYAKLKKLRLAPSGLCNDATFIRRAYLDVTGTLPNAEATEKFLADADPKKREKLVDELLGRKEFAELWVMKWAELLQIRSSQQLSYKSALSYYNWLQDKIARNVPMNEIVQELLSATGGTFKNPPTNYYQNETDTLKTAENVAQVFMGMRIQCAQCHNHPFDRWTMNDYYSFASFFARIGRKGAEDPRETVIFSRNDGEVTHPVGGRVMPPKFLGGAQPEMKDQDRRALLAKWIASSENPYFARNLVNLIWAHFLGKGIIEPVDDVRISNPASNPELLETLAKKFTEYNYDFKKLVREICNSRTYQLATERNDSNATDELNFSHGTIRRIRGEVLLDSITQVTETRDKFQGLPIGSRAVQIADGTVNTYFLTTFGRATRETVCSCEVKTEPNLSQSLHLLNGDTTGQKIQDGGVVKRLLAEKKTPPQIIENLFMRCLSRKPAEEELTKLNAFFKEGKPPEQVLNDVFWSLLNSKEFMFTH